MRRKIQPIPSQAPCQRCGKPNRYDDSACCPGCRQKRAQYLRRHAMGHAEHLKYPLGVVCALNREWM